MNIATNHLPRARREGLNVHAIGGEVLVFDTANETAHALNGPAAFVWQAADGTRTVDEIARAMSRQFGATADAQVVWYALEQLSKKNLLQDPMRVPVAMQGLTRRQLLKRAVAGALLLAVVTSIAAPTPAHAQSGCLDPGQNCIDTTQCCPTLVCCAAAGNTCQVSCGS